MRSNPSAHIHNDKIFILWKIKLGYHVYPNNKEEDENFAIIRLITKAKTKSRAIHPVHLLKPR